MYVCIYIYIYTHIHTYMFPLGQGEVPELPMTCMRQILSWLRLGWLKIP